jgi:hypothetical protein
MCKERERHFETKHLRNYRRKFVGEMNDTGTWKLFEEFKKERQSE